MARSIGEIAESVGFQTSTLDYLVNYDAERSIAYFETPKVACTAIKKYMQDIASGHKVIFAKASDVHDRSKSALPLVSQLAPETQEAVFFGATRRFGFVRNPFTRVLSAFLDKAAPGRDEREFHLSQVGLPVDAEVTFLQFLEALRRVPEIYRDIHFAPQARLLLAGDIDFEFIGHFESFEGDFFAMRRKIYTDFASSSYASFGQHHSTGANKKIQSYFGHREVELVTEIYRSDFEIFGYSDDTSMCDITPEPSSPLLRDVSISWKRFGLSHPDNDPASFVEAVLDMVARGLLYPDQAVELLKRSSELMSDDREFILVNAMSEVRDVRYSVPASGGSG